MTRSEGFERGAASKWVIYDDEGACRLLPLTWMRPASDLLLGAWTGRQRMTRIAGAPVREVCRGYLAPLGRGRMTWQQALPVSGGSGDPETFSSLWNGDFVWISSRVVPDTRLVESLADLDIDSVAVSGGRPIAFRPGNGMTEWISDQVDLEGQSKTGSKGGRVLSDAGGTCENKGAGAAHESMQADPGALLLGRLLRGNWPVSQTDARVLQGLADLIRFQDDLLAQDLQLLLAELPPPERAGDGHAYRIEDVRLGEGCLIDHGAVLDAREGPIVLGAGCHVFPHTWLRGPLTAGENCMFLGGRVGSGTSLGPVCRVRGEVEATVMLGFCNKAHDGFIGHSYFGEWINLGAMTTNSDLKNNYSTFRIEPYGRMESTGMTKVGAFLADHVKSRIGSLLGGGAVVGVGTNLVGDPAIVSRWIPDFLWGSDPGSMEYDVGKFLETARTVYGRRNVPWTLAVENALRMVHEATKAAREAFIRRAE